MRVSYLSAIIILSSCLNPNNQSDKKSDLRDSLIAEYLILQDSIQWINTVDPSRELLIAYNKNDTNYIQEVLENTQASVFIKNTSRTSCYTPKPINTFNFEEAFRFDYSTSFCDQAVSITIGYNNQVASLLAYHYTYDFLTDSCISFRIVEKEISNSQYKKIEEDLEYADLWGLKEKVSEVGFDGSSLAVTGYQKPRKAFEGRYTKVHRRYPEKAALGHAFKSALDLSGISEKCFKLD